MSENEPVDHVHHKTSAPPSWLNETDLKDALTALRNKGHDPDCAWVKPHPPCDCHPTE